MSWGAISVTSVEAAEVETALNTAAETYKSGLSANDYELDPAAVEAITAAVASAKAVVDSGIVGTTKVNVSLSGHANPGHVPVKGWANDFVQIVVSSAESQPTA